MSGSENASSSSLRRRLFVFILLSGLLVALFAVPLWRLIRYVLQSDLQSHVLLIPFICLYLVRLRKKPIGDLHPSPWVTALFGGLGAFSLLLYWFRSSPSPQDALTFSTLAFVFFLVALAFGVFGRVALRPHRFALGFLFFAVPLPLSFITGLSVALQHASAEVSDWALRLTGMPVYRENLTFQMPGLLIYVAEECSGIRATMVLFLTSILAAHLFLRTAWKQFLFVLMVFPLGVLRNAVRITTISWLTVNVDPGIIDSPLHHRGGPLFFVASLIPFFLLLWWLRRTEFIRPNVRTR